MHVDDRVDLVGAGAGLVDALRPGRHGLRRPREPVVEARYIAFRQTAGRGDRRNGRRGLTRRVECPGQPFRVALDEIVVQAVIAPQVVQQAGEQDHVGAWRDREMQVGRFGGRRAARIDRHETRGRVPLPGLHQSLMDHRMTPGRIRADQHDEIGQFQILVAARHQILAERAAVAGDAGGHAQPRVRVDVRRADEALHQLVRDVIVFGQQLARHVEGD